MSTFVNKSGVPTRLHLGLEVSSNGRGFGPRNYGSLLYVTVFTRFLLPFGGRRPLSPQKNRYLRKSNETLPLSSSSRKTTPFFPP